MKKLLLILSFGISSCGNAQFNIPLLGRGTIQVGETYAQQVTRQYIALNNLSGSDALAFKRATSSLESAGLYYKLIQLVVTKYYSNGKEYNMIIPLNYNGALMDSIRAGAITASGGGIVLHAGDTIDTHWINNLMANAPNSGVFWYTPTSNVTNFILYSASPFRVEVKDPGSGKAYINIWANATGITTTSLPGGFYLSQRVDASNVSLYVGTTKYTEAIAISTSNPQNNNTYFVGNPTANYTLYAHGFCLALTDTEEANLKSIIQQLLTDLGVI